MSPVLETIEHALHDVARFVEFSVVLELNLAVFAGRDAGDCFCFVQPIAQVVGIVAMVGDDGAIFGDIGLKTLPCLRNIRPIARCQT